MTQAVPREANDNPPAKRRYKKRGGDVSVCSRCENEPKLPGQRYGRACHAKAQSEHYARKRERQRKMREIIKVVQDLGCNR